jgi:hypothetical protein
MSEAHPPSRAKDAPIDIRHQWQQLTLHGNSLLEHGALDRATDTYRQARDLALEHCSLWPDAYDAVTALVVSCLNLSESLARAEHMAEAAATLCSVHSGMLRAAGDPRLPRAVCLAAQSRLRETYAALLRFQALHGERPEIARWLQQSRSCGALAADPTEHRAGVGLKARRPSTLH